MRKASMAAAAFLLTACSSIPQAPPAAVSDLAPTGKLRAAINVGNPVLAARAQTSAAVVDLFLKENHEVAAGVKQQLEADARRAPGVRLLPGRFMVINQAMASQRGREAGARYVRAFIEEMKATGFVAKALEDHKVQGAAVAPAGDAR